MRVSWKLARVAGIDVYLHPSFLLVLILAGVTQGGLVAVGFLAALFGCVLLHEFGHALTARLFGIETEDITLYPIGGLARLRRMPRAPGAELLITLAGPLVNVLIAAVLASALWLGEVVEPYSTMSFVGAFLNQLMWVNVGLAVFNLLPAFPMDGGRILRALLAGPLGRVRATEIAVGVGRVLAVALGALALFNGLWMQALLAAFVYFAAGAELDGVLADERSRDVRSGGADGVWIAPPGYRWIPAGRGAWQLEPIVVTEWDSRRPWR
jgi:Zn-dependent protease